ncbi:SOS cell division inhibitor [Marinobacter salinexigens]|uniref:Flagellar protein FliT n=1 Tax=Marinobacter salinexigens TaxID=2919747 RepID=A0A5B0VLB0_9GAMM|nr:flagellar protein FliT [Marinobacter salinexigens]KAA1174769.1 SOS cell division inhibitor [Marinobacter salinexigens]
MADVKAHLDKLDRLMGDLGRALADSDWEALAKLNAEVKPSVEPLMASLAAGEVDAETVRTRLQEIQQFVDAANASAEKARNEAREALKGVNQNRNAARTYQNVSTNRSS